MAERAERRLTTILAADVAEYSRPSTSEAVWPPDLPI